MQKILNYINSLGLNLTAQQLAMLEGYVGLVWDKKGSLNLTSVSSKEEIWARHIADGLTLASAIMKEGNPGKNFTLADLGSGAGYIGIACAVALPDCKVTLVESLEKRCAFMRWVILKLEIKNIEVLNIRAGEAGHGLYDFVTERAMGKLEDIFEICVSFVKDGGKFMPYQTQKEPGLSMGCKDFPYTLPEDDKERNIIIFDKNGHS